MSKEAQIVDPGSSSNPISKRTEVSGSTSQMSGGCIASVGGRYSLKENNLYMSRMNYNIHLAMGGRIINPNQIHPMPVPKPRYDRVNYDGCRNLEDQGFPTLAIAIGDGIIVAVNHSEKGSANLDILYEFDVPLLVSVTGAEVSLCKPLLETLKAEDVKWGFKKEWGIADPLAMVVDTLHCCPAVALVAGWDFRSDNPGLFRVDGMGTKIQGNVLATGSGYKNAYSYLNLWDLIDEMKFLAEEGLSPRDESFYSNILNDPSQYEKYSAWSAWSVEEAARLARKGICWAAAHGIDGKDFASVYFVGRDGVNPIYQDIEVEDFLKKSKLPLPLERGSCAYAI